MRRASSTAEGHSRTYSISTVSSFLSSFLPSATAWRTGARSSALRHPGFAGSRHPANQTLRLSAASASVVMPGTRGGIVAHRTRSKRTPADFLAPARLQLPIVVSPATNRKERSAPSFHACLPATSLVEQLNACHNIRSTNCNRLLAITALLGRRVQTHTSNTCGEKTALPNAGNYPSFELHLLSLLVCRAELTHLQHDIRRPTRNCLNKVKSFPPLLP